MAATREQIVYQFLEKDYSEWTQANWGLHKDRDYWDIGPDTGTYINGIPLIVDFDYRMGFLLEIVERSTSVVSYLVIVADPRGHDSAWYEERLVGTFFDRDVEIEEVMRWAVGVIVGLLEALDEDYS